MPKIKKEEEKNETPKKRKVVRKTRSTAIKKTRAPKASVKKDKELSSATQAITIDVITDNEDVLLQEQNSFLEDELQDSDNIDVQKKFFSDLVTEIKERKESNKTEVEGVNFATETALKSPRKSLKLYRRMALQSGLLTLLLLVAAAYFLLPSLKISIQPNFESVADTLSFRVSAEDTQVDSVIAASSRNLQGEVKFIDLNIEKNYEASGEEILGEEVVGEVTLHNEYSRAQPLVVNTRLLSEDNKLYRLKESVNIPANSTIQAEVYADQPGQEMAIGPSRFSIPGLWLGLQDRIYATSEKNFEYRHQIKRYVRQSDLDQAMIDIKNQLSKKAEAEIAALAEPNQALAYLLDNDRIKIELGVKLGEEIDSFNVSASNELVVALFPKEQAEALIKAKLSFLLPDDKRLTGFDPNNIVYRLDAYDRETESVSVSAAFKANMSLRTDADLVDRRQLVGLNKEQISEYLRSFPEIDSYRLEFFPAFIQSAPILPDRIKVDVVN
jgi:hypothetical protein